jgi:hypothetical protein
VLRGGPAREHARGEGGVPSSGRLEHVVSFGGINSAPTGAHTFGMSALLLEIRIWIRTRQGKHACARAGKLAAPNPAAQIRCMSIGTRSQKENGRPQKERPPLIHSPAADRLLELNGRKYAGSLNTNGQQGRGIETQSLEDRRRHLHGPHSFPYCLGLEA